MTIRIREMRSQTHTARFAASPQDLFEALHKPTAICSWWGASQAIAEPREGGLWAASWGDPDDPDFVISARIDTFRPPRTLVLSNYHYYAREASATEISANSRCSFQIQPDPNGSTLTIVQSGLPDSPQGDAFFEACHKGWTEVLTSLRDYFEESRG